MSFGVVSVSAKTDCSLTVPLLVTAVNGRTTFGRSLVLYVWKCWAVCCVCDCFICRQLINDCVNCSELQLVDVQWNVWTSGVACCWINCDFHQSTNYIWFGLCVFGVTVLTGYFHFVDHFNVFHVFFMKHWMAFIVSRGVVYLLFLTDDRSAW